MAIRTDEHNGVCVLSIDGDLANDEAGAFRILVDARADEGKPLAR